MASSTPDFIATYLPIPSLPLDWLLDIRVKRLYDRYLYTFGLDDGLHKLVTKNSGGGVKEYDQLAKTGRHWQK